MISIIGVFLVVAVVKKTVDVWCVKFQCFQNY